MFFLHFRDVRIRLHGVFILSGSKFTLTIPIELDLVLNLKINARRVGRFRFEKKNIF